MDPRELGRGGGTGPGPEDPRELGRGGATGVFVDG